MEWFDGVDFGPRLSVALWASSVAKRDPMRLAVTVERLEIMVVQVINRYGNDSRR